MPYIFFRAGQTVRVKGRKWFLLRNKKEGKVIAIGSPTNVSAQVLVRFSTGDPVWYAKDELDVVSEPEVESPGPGA